MVVNDNKRVNQLYRMIECKEGTWKTPTGASRILLSHNLPYTLLNAGGSALNPFASTQGAGDPMGAGSSNRIGDKITVKGLKMVFFFENALQRARVFYRLMLLKAPRGAAFARGGGDLFKNCADNKMIDMINTERYTIIAQRRFTINSSNATAATVGGTGVPNTATPAGIGTKVISMWVPGKRFGKGGNIQYEDTTAGDVKFFDYRIVCLAYDWFGTPQDINVVGNINEGYTKLYFKDA